MVCSSTCIVTFILINTYNMKNVYSIIQKAIWDRNCVAGTLDHENDLKHVQFLFNCNWTMGKNRKIQWLSDSSYNSKFLWWNKRAFSMPNTKNLKTTNHVLLQKNSLGDREKSQKNPFDIYSHFLTTHIRRKCASSNQDYHLRCMSDKLWAFQSW